MRYKIRPEEARKAKRFFLLREAPCEGYCDENRTVSADQTNGDLNKFRPIFSEARLHFTGKVLETEEMLFAIIFKSN